MRDDPAAERFWSVVDEFLLDGRLHEGTIMGRRCVRTVDGDEFVAMGEPKTGNLIVKLPRDRVTALIEDGKGTPFAPAGRVFREWVSIGDLDRRVWADLIEESIAFVGS